VISGSWNQAIADRIPDGSTVVIATHDDDAGDRYENKIIETLTGRVTLLRIPREAAS
jgi:ABC-type ATPase involved in cell division